ncbi:hypothetical protein ACFL1N_12255 [Thermodesulfobacteriota bacterium]
MFKKILILLILTFCFLLNLPVPESHADYGLEGTVYLKVNIHYQCNNRDCKASYANYTDPGEGHVILPVNTPVEIKKWGRRGFIVINKNNKEKILFEYHAKRMQMSIQDYLKHITSSSEVSLGKLSKKDKKGIEEGKASKGMTKDGVMMALGYPATHKTPSLKSDKWIYWANRFRTLAVNFDEDGVVTSVVD